MKEAATSTVLQGKQLLCKAGQVLRQKLIEPVIARSVPEATPITVIRDEKANQPANQVEREKLHRNIVCMLQKSSTLVKSVL